MRKLFFAALVLGTLAAACVHGPPAHWDRLNPPDAGTEVLQWG